MAIPADLKFDVRVRERLVKSGLLTDNEVEKHLEALPDLAAQAVELTAKQPALQAESDRDIVIVRTSGARPSIAPISRADELDIPLDDEDDDELDEDDDELDAKKPAAAKAAKEEAKPLVEEPAEAVTEAKLEKDDEPSETEA